MDETLAELLARSDTLFERGEIERAIDRVAASIRRDYAAQRPLMLTVMQGGLPFAGLLALAVGAAGGGGTATEPGVDLEFDYVHATRYGGETVGAGLRWLRHPTVPLAGRRVLLVDDILDEGHTLAGIREWCLQQEAEDVGIAVLVEKRHDRRVTGLAADYRGLEVPDRYVFGFGMDYRERGRCLPSIHAVRA